jgi:hypothetical protein
VHNPFCPQILDVLRRICGRFRPWRIQPWFGFRLCCCRGYGHVGNAPAWFHMPATGLNSENVRYFVQGASVRAEVWWAPSSAGPQFERLVANAGVAELRGRRRQALHRDRSPWQVAMALASGHVWTAPGWQVLSSRMQQWSEQPCVRPVSAVHLTAGHNALRGSGPGHKHAFDNAVARVGCPDRRIDRLCITCCSPFPTVTSRRMSDAISFTPRVRRFPCSARL